MPVHIVGTVESTLRSAHAKSMKYEKSMCAKCNNVRSKSIDDAFDAFCVQVRSRSIDGVPPANIPASDIFPADTETSVSLLLRSYAKDLACRVRSSGRDVPFRLRDFVIHGSDVAPECRVAFFRARPGSPQQLVKSALFGGCGESFQYYAQNYTIGGLVTLVWFGDNPSTRHLRGVRRRDRIIRLAPLREHPLPFLINEAELAVVVDVGQR
jgi:hypothetical protein